jgi:hypothetical protein
VKDKDKNNRGSQHYDGDLLDGDKDSLYDDLDSLYDDLDSLYDDLVTFDINEEDKDSERKSEFDDSSVNIPFNGSPLYPSIYTGNSNAYGVGQYPESEHIDDNVHNTWLGVMSFYG